MTRATDTERRACEWLIRSEGATFTEGMRTQLQRWLLDPRNRITFLRIKEAWRRAGLMRSARPLDGDVDPDLLKDADLTFRSNSGSANNEPRAPLRIAAGAALSLISYLLGFAGWVTLSSFGWTHYETSIGGYEHITLADGSGIQLNTDSELRSRLTSRRPEVELIRGEALIRVPHDTRGSLTISAANIAVHADPADEASIALVVRVHTPNTVEFAVTQGSVVLEPSGGLIATAFRRNPFPRSTLQEGEAATIHAGGVRLRRVGLEKLNRKLSWTAGLLSFQGETLTEVTEEFNRYNRKHLIVADPLIAARRIGGAFQATDPDSFVSALQKSFGIQATEDPEPSGHGAIRLTSTQ